MKEKKVGINNKVYLSVCIILVLCMIIAFLVLFKGTDNNSEISIIINNEDVTLQLKEKVLIQNDVIYLSFEDVKNCIDETIYYEEENNIVLTSSERKLAALKLDEDEIEINGAKVSINGQALKMNNNLIYLPISELKNVYDYEFYYIPENNKVIIDYYSKRLEKASIKNRTSIKKEKNVFSSSLERIKKGEDVVIISKEDNWTKVRTKNGNIGFVKNNKLENFNIERENFTIDNTNDSEEYLEKNIKSKNINSYEERKRVINDILIEAVSKQYKNVKILYDDTESESYKRFIIEVVPVLKECGINVI